MIRIKRRWLKISTILLFLFALVFAFLHVNCLVSYKYEVQDSLHAYKKLTKYQQDIVDGIGEGTLGMYACGLLLFINLVVLGIEPKFKDRVDYY